MRLNLGNMQRKLSGLNGLEQMTKGVYLVKKASQEAGEEIDDCFRNDPERRIILNSAETFAKRLNKRTIRLYGINKRFLSVVVALMIV